MRFTNFLPVGKLRHRIAIKAPSGTTDSFGGITAGDSVEWALVICVWGRIETISGQDAAAAGTFVSQVTHRVTIRNPRYTTIAANQQVWFEGRVFIIQAVVNPDETNKMLYLLCKEIN